MKFEISKIALIFSIVSLVVCVSGFAQETTEAPKDVSPGEPIEEAEGTSGRVPQPKIAGVIPTKQPVVKPKLKRAPQPKLGGPIPPTPPAANPKLQRAPQPKIAGKITIEKPVPKIVVGRAPQPKIPGVKLPDRPGVQPPQPAPTPEAAGIEEPVRTIEETLRLLEQRKEDAEKQINETSTEDKLKKLKLQTAALEIEIEIEKTRAVKQTVLREMEARKNSSYTSTAVQPKQPAAASPNELEVQRDQLIRRAKHIDAAMNHLREAEMPEMARELEEQLRGLHHQIRRTEMEIHRRQQQKAQGTRSSRPPRPTAGNGSEAANHQEFREEVIGAIRELNRSIREMQGEVRELRNEIDRTRSDR